MHDIHYNTLYNNYQCERTHFLWLALGLGLAFGLGLGLAAGP